MRRIIEAFVSTFAVAVLLTLWSAAGQAGGDKPPGWKPFLPPDDYQELLKRSLERIRTLAKDETATRGLRAEALILAGFSISSKDATASAGLRQKAIKVATLAASKDTAAEARKLAGELPAARKETKAAGAEIDWPAAIGEIADLMTPLANKAKGGEGLHADLQYTAKLKSQNGIEALLVALATKQLSAANAGKLSKELEVVGFRVATIGALTRRRGPHKNKDDVKQWDAQSVLMRDIGVELAEAAGRKDAPTILAASKRLMSTCVECHTTFK